MRSLLFFASPLLIAATAIVQPIATANPAAMAVRPGSWSYVATQTGSEASFMDTSGTAQLALRCVRATRTVVFSVPGAPATSMAVWTSSASRNVAANYDPAMARVSGSFAAADPLLDAIAFSRGRFSISVAGLSPLVVPAWPEPARAIEDCRN